MGNLNKKSKQVKRNSRKKHNKSGIKNLPFSKQTVTYARLEAYIFSLILIVMVWFDKDVSAIAILLSLAWAGYKGLGCVYLWMCKHEHLMDKKIEYKKLGLDSSDIDEEIEILDTEEIEFNDI